jgi:hypothetical protein
VKFSLGKLVSLISDAVVEWKIDFSHSSAKGYFQMFSRCEISLIFLSPKIIKDMRSRQYLMLPDVTAEHPQMICEFLERFESQKKLA